MPEDEAQESKEANSGGGGLLGGKKGWFIVIAVVLLEAVGFLTMMYLQTDKKGDVDPTEKVARVKPDDYGSVIVDKLMYSILTQGNNSATLSMDISIVVGPTPEDVKEKRELSKEDLAVFMGAIVTIIPDIKDKLIQYIGKQTFNQLNSSSGKEKIKQFVKNYVNDELEKMDLKDKLVNKELKHGRVHKVLIMSFHLQG